MQVTTVYSTENPKAYSLIVNILILCYLHFMSFFSFKMYPIYNIVRNIVSMFVIGYTLGDCIGLFSLLCVCIANQASEAEAYM